jgi:hypothetical protein
MQERMQSDVEWTTVRVVAHQSCLRVSEGQSVSKWSAERITHTQEHTAARHEQRATHKALACRLSVYMQLPQCVPHRLS